MLKRTYIAILSCLCFSEHASAQLAKCEASLVPTETSGASAYSRTVSYMYLNAEEEYDKLKNSTDSQRSASASYKAFSAEYGESTNKSEFSEKVRNRLRKEGFSLSEDEAKSSYRRFLTPEQLKAWETCVATTSGVSQVLLSSKEGAANAIPIKMQWWAGQNRGTGTLKLLVANGKINGKTYVDKYLAGSGEYAWFVTPDNNTDPVLLIANIEGASDSLTILRKYPDFKPNVAVAEPAKGGIIKAITQPYTTQDEGRLSKTITCPDDMEVVSGSGSCHRTANDFGQIKKSAQAGTYTWACQWDTAQPVGVGIHAEAVCRTASKPELFRKVEHVRQSWSTGGSTDNRQTKQFFCPNNKKVVPGSGLCFRTALDFGGDGTGQQVGDNGWSCQWPTKQPEGVGIWIEMDCGVAVK